MFWRNSVFCLSSTQDHSPLFLYFKIRKGGLFKFFYNAYVKFRLGLVKDRFDAQGLDKEKKPSYF